MRFFSIGPMARLSIVALIGLMAMAVLHAQSIPENDYKKLIRVNDDLQPLSSTPFGENIGLYTGNLSFDQTDISLQGDGPPVQLSRHLDVVGGSENPLSYEGAFADWVVDIPRLETETANQNGVTGWQVNAPNALSRCSSFVVPPTVPGIQGNFPWEPVSWWFGVRLFVPGQGSQNVLARADVNTVAPSSDNYPVVTKSNWMFSCGATASDGGEGFVGLAPDGTKYVFSYLVYKEMPTLYRPLGSTSGALAASAASSKGVVPYASTSDFLARRKGILYVTSVTDRFGNTLTYNYAGNHLTSIAASDGREIDLGYSSDSDFIQTATVKSSTGPTRTWTYAYSSSPAPTLTSVTLPDSSSWSFNLGAFLTVGIVSGTGGCEGTPSVRSGTTTTGSMTTPSGLTGTFQVSPITRGRSYVPKECYEEAATGYQSFSVYPDLYYPLALTTKTVAGAGLASQTWSYAYGSPNASYKTDDCATAGTCATTITTDVTDPSGNTTRYTYSNRFDVSEGQLLQSDYYSGGVTGTPLRTEGYQYTASGAWPSVYGQDLVDRTNVEQTEQAAPMSLHTVLENGDTYSWQAESFDQYTQVTQLKRSNSITGQQPLEESTAYLNDTNTWVLGLPQTVTNVATGEVESSNAYNGLDELTSRARFGQTLMNYSYDAQGNLASFTDGNNHTTTLSNYKRGIPQSISYPDNASQSLAVDDFGQITSITDPLGATTGYQYDNAGRVVWVQPPGDDEVAWHATAYNYSFVPDAERGIAGNHWRRITTKGSSLTFQYYDAMLRPILTDTFISGDDTTHSNIRTDYDWRSQSTFASYPVAGAPDLGSISAGIHTSYDALGREVQRQSDSEQGLLTTTTGYQAGTTKSTTDPKGNTTTIAYQSFDQPAYDQPIKVIAPEGVTQTVTRDIYGNPLQIAQSGTYNGQVVSIARNFTYDSYHRLCRRYEPESNSEVIDYDAANNLAWRATGVAVAGDASVCGRDQVADSVKFVNAYDAMNRVVSSTAPSGTQSTTYQYDAAGRVVSQVSGSVIQGYSYNKRGMLTSEVQWIPSLSYSRSIGYTHNPYGDVEKITYPDGAVFGLFPDALGRSTVLQGGDTLYVENPSYFPDGGVQSYVLGNGISVVVQRNARQLPANLSYGQNGGLNFSEDYAYDADGNVNSIQDLVNGHNTQTLAYDGLSRLISAEAANSWGKETYTYDPLNNARGKTVVGAGIDLDLAFNYDTTNRLASMTRGSGGFSTYQYDARGNRTHEQIVYTTHDYSFDAKNQILAASGVANYAYDGDGRRVTKTLANGKLTHSFYSQAGKLMYAYDESTGQATDYLYWGGHLVARWVAGAPTYLLTDRLGSVVKEADATGAITASYTYRPYGAEFEGPTQTEPGYTGHVSDPETALVYMQARYYDPAVGRFLSTDPVAPKPSDLFNFNRYAYANDNPINRIDPDGRVTCNQNSCTLESRTIAGRAGEYIYVGGVIAG